MHVLWISDNPDTPSGFGNVTRFVCQGLTRVGHQVSILGWQARQAHEWNGCKVLPMGSDPMGGDALFTYLVRHRPEVVIALADVWWLPYFTAPHIRRQMELIDAPWVLYFPIDGNSDDGGLPPSWIDLLREVDVPVAMSRYGQQVAQRCGIECEYIPHGVDLDLFCPPADREEAKARVGAGGKFVVLSDSRNQPRKMLPRLLEIFAKFAAGRQDVLLHLHTDPEDEFTKSGYYSYDVRADLHHLGIDSQARFTHGFAMKPGGGISLADLAAYYQAADVHLLASSGEGFGLPNLQAAAAGAVPMAAAYSASRELVEGHGESIAVSDWTANEFGIRRALIDMDDAVEKLSRFYRDRGLLQERSRQSRRFAISYGWREVVAQWDKLLRSIARRGQRVPRSPSARVESLEKLAPRVAPRIPGVSVRVTVVERQLGRVEAALLADARRHQSDGRIPVVPKACEVGNLRVPRRPAYVCVAAGDLEVFQALKLIFPALSGWIPVFSPLAEPEIEDLELAPLNSYDDGRYKLAQSILVLNLSGEISEPMLTDAAYYGVPCVGFELNRVQTTLWPDLQARTVCDATRLARKLLTDLAFYSRAAERARMECRRVFSPDEAASIASLRRLHAQETASAAVVSG